MVTVIWHMPLPRIPFAQTSLRPNIQFRTMVMDFHILYFPEKMTNFVALIFVLVGSMVERAGAVSCYSCTYASIQPQETPSSEPFDAKSAPTCSGTVCSIGFVNFTGSLSKSFNV